MQSFFKDIFIYHHHFNQKLGEQLQAHAASVPERAHFLFSHFILAHQIWNSRILGQQPMALNQTLAVDQCLDLDRINLEASLNILDTVDLGQTIHYQNSKGQRFINTVLHILFHLSNHSSHHKGQLVAELRRSGIDPVVTDYIFYKRQEIS